MQRKIYDPEKIQYWADNERDTYVSAGVASLAEVVAAGQQQEDRILNKVEGAPFVSEPVEVEPKRRIRVSSQR